MRDQTLTLTAETQPQGGVYEYSHEKPRSCSGALLFMYCTWKCYILPTHYTHVKPATVWENTGTYPSSFYNTVCDKSNQYSCISTLREIQYDKLSRRCANQCSWQFKFSSCLNLWLF